MPSFRRYAQRHFRLYALRFECAAFSAAQRAVVFVYAQAQRAPRALTLARRAACMCDARAALSHSARKDARQERAPLLSRERACAL